MAETASKQPEVDKKKASSTSAEMNQGIEYVPTEASLITPLKDFRISPIEILRLQRHLGNKRTGELFRPKKAGLSVIQRDKADEIGDKAEIGVELEFRNITVYNAVRDWGDNIVESLTTGGDDGELKTDQVQKRNAIIEWASSHPAGSTTSNGALFQNKANKLIKKLSQKNTGKLIELVDMTKEFFKVGDVIEELKQSVTYKYKEGPIQTQTNIEVPFENIGMDLRGTDNAKSDATNLFSGGGSAKAGMVFAQSRTEANTLAQAMLEDYNGSHSDAALDKSAAQSLASVFTVFLHTEILGSLEGGKDAQGVLFKTGAGDLVRTALNDPGKKVLWYYVNEKAESGFSDKLSEIGKSVYTKVFPQRGGDAQLTKLSEAIKTQAMMSFARGADNPYKAEQKGRYGKEETGYGSEVRTNYFIQGNRIVRDDNLDPNQPFQSLLHMSGTATGKEFEVTVHESNDGTVSSKYIVAEIRKLDNELNQLAGKQIEPDVRKQLGEKVKALQKPVL